MSDWIRFWQRAGDLCVRRADCELDGGNFDLACRSYLTAAEHYWLALSAATTVPPEGHALRDAHVSAFRSALSLLPHPATVIELSVGAQTASGYLFMPAGGVSVRPAVIWPVEPTSTVESSYRHVALPVLESHAACALFAASSATCFPSDPLVDAVVQWVRDQRGIDHIVAPRAQLCGSRRE